jgi:hypothetical protein
MKGEGAFGFIKPEDVIRGVHIMPCQHRGKTSDLLPPSPLARGLSEEDEDWVAYYVNMWVIMIQSF